MTDQEQSDREKHWQELAEQLGLPAEPERSPSPTSPAPRAEPFSGSAEPPHNRGENLKSRKDEPRAGNRPATDLGKEDAGRAKIEDADPAVPQERKPQRKSSRKEALAKREKEPPVTRSEPSDSSAQGRESDTEEKRQKGRRPGATARTRAISR